MKTMLTSVLLFGATFLGAQVPNSSFESWTNFGTYSDPDNWQTSNNNSGNVVNVTQVSNAHTGSSAMKMEAWTYMNYTFSSAAACPFNGGFFPVTGQPAALTGWYMATFLNGDKAQIPVALQQAGTSVAGGMVNLTSSTSVYQQFSIPLTYNPQTAMPDSGAIAIALYTSGNGGVGLTPGTFAIFDDIQLTAATAVNESPSVSALEKIYPNPANDGSWIEYTVNGNAAVNISVFDINGNLLQTLVDQDQSTGRFRVHLDTSVLSSGLYLVKLQTGDSYSSMKLNVIN